MAPTPRHLRRSLIALAAVVAALTGWAGDASACSAMESATGVACSMTCGCCSGGAGESRAPGVEASREPVVGVPANCEAASGGDCSCRPGEPAAPEPRPARASAEGRPEPARQLDLAGWGLGRSARVEPSSVAASPRYSAKVPTYLRIERLLF